MRTIRSRTVATRSAIGIADRGANQLGHVQHLASPFTKTTRKESSMPRRRHTPILFSI